jgi:glycosyltransferase involved in cell wall biosynthesis
MEILTNAAIFLLIFILGGWVYRSGRSLSELKQAPTLKIAPEAFRHGRVSVLIPAKNEEGNIGDCVRPLLAQLREGDELIVINNCSTDRTEAILKELGAIEIRSQASFESSQALFKYLNTPQTPEGWTGKNFALHLGIEHAVGDWFLFTDADTRHQPGSIDASIGFAEEKKLELLTLLPRCLAHGFLENLIQPCAMAYMGLWFPVRKINDPRSKIHFANGQYLLIRADHYRKIGGHHAVKEAFLEDFALMKRTKEMNARGMSHSQSKDSKVNGTSPGNLREKENRSQGMCAFGMEIYGTRMYDSFNALWRGWRRIFLHAYEQHPWPILRCALSVFFFSVFPFVALAILLQGAGPAFLLAAMNSLIALATAATAYAIVKAPRPYALLHPVAAFIFTAILLDAFQMAVFSRKTHWR